MSSTSSEQQLEEKGGTRRMSLSPGTGKEGNRRRSSSIISRLEPETIEEQSDQSSLPNLNADWVNNKGKSVPDSKTNPPSGFLQAPPPGSLVGEP